VGGPKDPGPGISPDPLAARIYCAVLAAAAVGAFVAAVVLIITGG
jgi:hypothetical protein